MTEPTQNEGCAHRRVVPSKRYEDGSVDGRCEDCGEEGFPLRDVGYERLQREDAVEAAELRGVPCVVRERYRDATVEELACEVLGFPGERLPLEGETERVYRLLTTLDEKVQVAASMQETVHRLEKSAGAIEAALVELHKRS